ncbi:hypothetical protein [Glaciihabitans sp. UYNi722]|uniref:hypothetical protein n=1 Tax=Glaciihabitans sp. UYNi722 TaxID=3156344 RepID=UPI003391754F
MNRSLAERYRRALRWYPRSWRNTNEDEVVGTLLDVADGESRTAPERGELVNLAVNGIAARIGAFIPSGVRDRVAAVALAAGTAYSMVYLFFDAWAPFATQFYVAPSQRSVPLITSAMIICALWILGMVFALVGVYRGARIAIGATILAVGVLTIVSHSGATELYFFGPTVRVFVLLAGLGVLGLAGASRSRKLLTIAFVGALAFFLAVYVKAGVSLVYFPSGRSLWEENALGRLDLSWLLVVTLMVAIGFAIAGRGSIAAVIALSTLPWVGMWLELWLAYSRWTIIGLLVLVALAAGVVVLLTVALRRSGFEISIKRSARK